MRPLPRHRRHLILLAPLVPVLGSCQWFGDLAERETASPTAARCGECHGTTFEEWRDSRHAHAFTSPAFLAHTDGGTMDRCNVCHVPSTLPVGLERPLTARRSQLDEGVHCLACHRLPDDHAAGSGATMAGPLASHAPLDPHPVTSLEEWYRDSAFCGRCHEDSHAEVAEAESEFACQECHMPRVRRKVTQPTGMMSSILVGLEPELDLRSHAFSVRPAVDEATRLLGRDAFDAEARDDTGTSTVVVRNALPHSIPTGRFGQHTIIIRVVDDGAVLGVRELQARGDRELPPGGEIEIPLGVPLPASARLEVTRRAAGYDDELLWDRPIPDRSQLPAASPRAMAAP